jgi:hypothetical protein
MNSSKSGSGPKGPDREPQGQSKPGATGPGEAFNPMDIPDDAQPGEDSVKEPKAAPAPGIPMSDEQYEWLKRKAKVVRTPPSKHRQEDPSAKRRK